jgi:outer membrane cobalamin receptor
VDRARTEGIEVDIRRAFGGWVVATGYDYLHARDLGNNLPLDRRAAHTGRVRVTRLLGFLSGGTLDVTARYTGPAPVLTTASGQTRVTGEREAFFSTDAQLAGRVTGGVAVNLGVDNLFDARPADWPGRVERRYYLGLRAEVLP